MSNLVTTSLPNYVDENRLPLIAESALGSKSAKLFNLMTGVKHSAALNLLSTDVQFGNGATCGWDAAGNQELSQRILVAGNIKVNMAYCERELLDIYLSHEVKVRAGAETMPFEEMFVESVVKNIQALIERGIYQGDTASEVNNLKYFDGLIKILTAAAETVDINVSSKTAAWDKVMGVYAAIPETAFERGDVAILVGMDTFHTFTTELVSKNLYHYNAGTPDGEVVLPGTNVRVIGVNGLNGTKKAIGASLKNLVFGTDMMGDDEAFDFWYSKDNQEFRLVVKFNAGVQVAFPDEVVLGAL